ncbi:acetoin dehydrogenase dihydrolipoyllysine-residue acetyltransferase subunit [Burkholderia aenigmatica]|uniref:Acetoin dehydrogenase dihydrolipoyllysine-residue acetyltransferase subunit n=1 Tax=Burkholderia aenigmatica TaxID=2015348 RepID=A0A228INC3_9BURK|nr:acetoin dehydrogenase dihydrolipoyllysine-residue acetyltransferase subunit [Burkholderia aenigmatica]OXI43848.1 acetoin dehydrogenase dihydrolipoyllysine-residue acetyltransferase subunit [Burkholderia aenigmatica]
MSKVLMLPRLGETMEQGRVVTWLKQPGQSFVRGETIVEIETDKTIVELPALVDGVLRSIAAEEGADVDVGATLGHYDVIGEERDAASEESAVVAGTRAEAEGSPAAALKATSQPPEATPRTNVQSDVGERMRATPNARRIARRTGIDLVNVLGTGRRARIQGADVEAAAGIRASTEVATSPGAGVHYRNLCHGRIAFREWGSTSRSNVPIVLLHGYGGDSQVWVALASQLQRAGRHLFAPDLPSHGATDFDGTDPQAIADAIVAFVNDLQLDTFELVGHSLGGAIATKVAVILGHRVARLTLLAPAGLGSEIDGDFIEGMARVTHGGGLAHLLRRIAMTTPLLSATQLDQMAASIREREALAPLSRRLVSNGRQQVDIGSDLAVLSIPVCVIWGLEDKIIPWNQATCAGSAIPVYFLPQCGHMPQWDQPHKLAELLS